MDKKRFVTARSVTDNTHILIDAQNPLGCFKVAQELHKLGEHKYTQIRLRSTKPSLKQYKLIPSIYELIQKIS